jgi:hypothetical protein
MIPLTYAVAAKSLPVSRSDVAQKHRSSLEQSSPSTDTSGAQTHATADAQDRYGNAAILALAKKSDGFTDINSEHWAYGAVTALADEGIVQGVGDGSFGAGSVVNQAECIKMLAGAAGISVDSADTAAWYAPYIALANQKGMLVGAGDPAHEMTRAEVAMQASVLLALPSPAGQCSAFNDLTEAHPYYHSVIAAINASLIQGDGGSMTVRPNDVVNRAEIAVIAHRMQSTSRGDEGLSAAQQDVVNEAVHHLGGPASAPLVDYLKELGPEGAPAKGDRHFSIWTYLRGGFFATGSQIYGVSFVGREAVIWDMTGVGAGFYIGLKSGLGTGFVEVPPEGKGFDLDIIADLGIIPGINEVGANWSLEEMGGDWDMSLSGSIGPGEYTAEFTEGEGALTADASAGGEFGVNVQGLDVEYRAVMSW